MLLDFAIIAIIAGVACGKSHNRVFAMKRSLETPNPGNKAISLFYFAKVEGKETLYKCKCGIEREKQAQTGWTNLMSHIRADHSSYLTEFKSAKSPNNLTFHTPKTLKIFGWLDWIVSCSLPFNVVTNETFKKYTHLPPITITTCMNYLEALTLVLEKKITKMLPDKFALVFDGWSLDGTSTHFVAAIAKWIENGTSCRALLAFSPLLDEASQTAENHKEFLEFVLGIFQKKFTNVICLIGDNCATNLALANLCNKPLIGCAAHRFNLAIQKHLKDSHETLLNKVILFIYYILFN